MTAPTFPGWAALESPPDPRWLAVSSLRLDADPAPDARDLNAWVNRTIRYEPDVIDRWQPPGETLHLGCGDCEDFAILKRAVLLVRGWPADRLALVIGRDLVARRDHAVLWVDGAVWDNLSDAPISPADLVTVFRPKFAFGAGAWAYGRKVDAAQPG